MKDSYQLTSTEIESLNEILTLLKFQQQAQEKDVQKAWTNCTSCWGGSCSNGFTG